MAYPLAPDRDASYIPPSRLPAQQHGRATTALASTSPASLKDFALQLEHSEVSRRVDVRAHAPRAIGPLAAGVDDHSLVQHVVDGIHLAHGDLRAVEPPCSGAIADPDAVNLADVEWPLVHEIDVSPRLVGVRLHTLEKLLVGIEHVLAYVQRGLHLLLYDLLQVLQRLPQLLLVHFLRQVPEELLLDASDGLHHVRTAHGSGGHLVGLRLHVQDRLVD
mmetsp:Transcript_42723/g.117934  ORF Transcript_42723/g.117934 Transcript_42723/m.117934 type:complete len:219 (+) Transcript_42723:104-760(+)